MKILFASRWFPYPADNGSKIRVYNLLKALSTIGEIDLISFCSESIEPAHIIELKKYCQNVQSIRFENFQPHHWKAAVGLFSKKPRSMVQTFSQEMSNILKKADQEHKYDVVVSSQIDMIQYVEGLNIPYKILEELEITTYWAQIDQEKSWFIKMRRMAMVGKLVSYLRSTVKKFNVVTVVSQDERDKVNEVLLGQVPVIVIPNGVDIAGNSRYLGIDKEKDPQLIFNGALSFYANYDAMLYFVCEILPLIKKRYPQIKVLITGRTKGLDLSSFPKDKNVIFTGYLDDVRPSVAQSWAAIVPLRIGGGTRLKILEAISLGTPVVTTPKGVEGLELAEGKDYLIAETPNQFADQVIKLIERIELRSELSARAYETICQKYDWKFSTGKLIEIIRLGMPGR